MKRLALAGLAAGILAIGPVMAADLSPRSAPILKAAPPPAPVMNWTGCYLDGGGGFGFWKQDLAAAGGALPVATVSTSAGGNGWFGTVGGGCDYQFNSSWLIGGFAYGDFANLSGTPTIATVQGNENNDSAWGFGGRIGYVVAPSLLTFFEGGFSQAHFQRVDLFSVFVPAPASGSSIPDHNYSGYFIGGGVEYVFPWWPGLFVRNDYRYAKYGTDNIPIVATATGIPTGTVLSSSKAIQTVRTELVYRFNPGFLAPLMSRY
jgi:outer membrane immunogenic protein